MPVSRRCDIRTMRGRSRTPRFLQTLCALLLCGFCLGISPHAVSAEEAITPEQTQFFETKIRPVLVKQCYSCHSAQAADLGGKLRLDTRAAMRTGGESGPAVAGNDPEATLLIHALRYDGLEMPPEAPLPEGVINDFVAWIKMGAPDPRRNETVPAAAEPETPQSTLWSLQPIRQPELPEVQQADWPVSSLDRFVLAQLEAAQLQPTGTAAPETLLRRLCYDLTGLPPSAEQKQKFLQHAQSDLRSALETLVDELLASPQFGVHWGRHWLDVARYGESNGNDGLSRNPTFPHAWRYRDYVVEAFNRDTPYDQFLTEQIAGDLLTADDPAERNRQLIATGFLALGSKPAKAMNIDFEMDIINDQIDVVSTAVMGLSVACARCHDHKHDPIPTADYYALAGIFLSTETMWGKAANEKLTAPATPLHELASLETADADSKDKKAAALAMGVREQKKIRDCKINIKGESNKLGPEVPRGFLSACQLPSAPPSIPEEHSGRRELAEWLTHPGHPLTARVMANRIWLHLFGQGLVITPDDFGVYGSPPTHPELLDHLAIRFQEEGWSIKQLIREIVLSRVYQLDSAAPAELIAADPDNRLYTRHLRRRLQAEEIRDSILAASGQLDLTPGQGSIIQELDVLVNQQGNMHQPSRHRSIYLCYLRNSPPPELMAFDLPDALRPLGQRNSSTLPSQSLFLLNSPFLIEQAQHLADRLLTALPSENATPPEQIHWLYQTVFNRAATPQEQEQATRLLTELQPTSSPADNSNADHSQNWNLLCQALLAASEFRYVD